MEDKNTYAVIALAGKQYLVKVGDKITSEKVDIKEGETLKVTDVLLVATGDNVQIGQPFIEEAVVELEFTGASKSDKILVSKYKSKSRYRKVQGHRQQESNFTVKSIKS